MRSSGWRPARADPGRSNTLMHDPYPQIIALRDGLDRAADPAALAVAAGAVRGACGEWVAAGLGALAVTAILADCSDRLTRRAIELTLPRHRLPPTEWCWLGLGSEGRGEQTLLTDQDNALLFRASDGREAEAMRERFLPFAREVNQLLAACGLPLCDGGVMAGNAACCLSLDEWQACFARWIRLPQPEALLNVTIYFDFRGLYGALELAAALRREISRLAQGADIFAHMLAELALQTAPPLGRIRDFSAGAGAGMDLKKFGSRLFVDAARCLALAHGVAVASTLERITALVGHGGVAAIDSAAAHGAFATVQELRLRSQLAGTGNLSYPDRLDHFSRGGLLLALRQARVLQALLKTRFHVET